MIGTHKYQRFHCHGAVQLTGDGNRSVWGHVGEICLAGFYVFTYGPWPINTDVKFHVEVEGTVICGVGTVATRNPGVGMSIVFHNLSPEYQQELESVIHELSKSAVAPAGMGLRI